MPCGFAVRIHPAPFPVNLRARFGGGFQRGQVATGGGSVQKVKRQGVHTDLRPRPGGTQGQESPENLLTKTDGTQYETKIYVFPDNRNDFRGFCTCPFSENGTNAPVCKHTVEVHNLLEWEESGPEMRQAIAETLREQREREEEAYYQALCEEWESNRLHRLYGQEAVA